MFNHRPDDWLGGSSPNRSLGDGPNSPKKKTMSWKTAQDMLQNKNDVTNKGDATGIEGNDKKVELPISIIDLAGDEDTDGTEYEEEEIIEVDDGTSSENEDDETSYQDPNEYEEEIIEEDGSSEPAYYQNRADDDSDASFEALPPPIAVPNALRPVHLREQEKPKVNAKYYDSSDSNDSDDDNSEDDNRDVQEKTKPTPVMEKMKEASEPMTKRTTRPLMQRQAPPEPESESEEEAPIFPMRPGMMRGNSFEEDPPLTKEPSNDSSARHGTVRGHSLEETKKIAKSNDHSLRPTAMRGNSFEEKPEKKKPLFTRPIEKSNDHSLRPTTARGHSFEDKPPPRKWKPTPAPAPVQDEQEDADEDGRPNIAWKKPDWVKTPLLRQTSKAQIIKQGGNLAKPITNLPHMNPDGPFEKPDWTEEQRLRETAKGEQVKQGSSISRPIGGIKPIED